MQSCGPFFKLLTLLVEGSGGGAGGTGGLPCFTQLVLARLWECGEVCPHAALEWLALQVPRNKAAHAWALRTAERWVEPQLLAAGAARVRAAAALLLVALVPSQHFRAGYARARPPPAATMHTKLPDTAHHTLHQVPDTYTLNRNHNYHLIKVDVVTKCFIKTGKDEFYAKICSHSLIVMKQL